MTLWHWRWTRQQTCVSTFFLVVLLLGACIVRDYGISWDEPRQREVGAVSARYLAEVIAPGLVTPRLRGIAKLDDFPDRAYGVAFETPAYVVEKLLGVSDTRDVFLLRHLLNFLVFVGGAFAMYRLAARRFASWGVGLLAVTLLILSPRIFADAFYNSKDLVFLSVFLIGTNTLIALVIRPSLKTAIVHAVATAVAIDVRLIGVVLFLAAILVLSARVIKREVDSKQAVLVFTVLSGLTVTMVVAMFPWLWTEPVAHFLEAFTRMTHFSTAFPVRYMGQDVLSSALPWHYVPVWIAITTPPLYLALLFVGVWATVHRLATAGFGLWRNESDLQDLIFLALLCVPIAAVIGLRSILYDGWRHMYFVYPAMLLLVIRGCAAVWAAARGSTARACLVAVVGVSCGHTAWWMFRAHPVQNVYFNVLAGREWRRNFDLDYWGLGNRQAVEYILAHDPDPTVSIRRESWTPLEYTLLILRPEERSRIRLVENVPLQSGPFYVLDNYRQSVDISPRPGVGRELFYQLTVDDEIVLSVYKATSR